MKGLSVVEQRIIDQYFEKGAQIKGKLASLKVKDLVRLMRKRLYMTQRQLAKRAGVPHSTISRIENGEVEPTLGMLTKIFQAMESDFILLPLSRIQPDHLLREQAKKKAEKRLKYLEGTMALEKQKPEIKWMQQFLESEIEEILRHGSGIWDDER